MLPPAGDDWGPGAKRWAYLRAMNYGFMGQWLPMWTETGLALNKKSQEWMMSAFEVDPRWTTVNVYDEQMGGALHCREGAITKSQYTVVAPFLAAALGEASTDAPTPGSDGAAGRSHAVLLWTAVVLLLF